MRIFLNTVSAQPSFTAKNKKKSDSPSVCLYEKFRQGERPDIFSYSDKSTERLDFLAERYRKTPTIRNKRALLNHERKMLYEELSHPELTLARNYTAISPIIPKNTKPEVVDNIITNFNLTGLARLERLSKPFETRYTGKKMKLLDKIYDRADESKPFGEDVRFNVLSAIEGVNYVNKNRVSAEEDFFGDLAELYKETKSADALKGIMIFGKKENKPQITGIIEDVLKSENAEPEAKLLALWGGGKFRNDKIFGALKNVALDKNAGIQEREFALHSVSLYIKEKPDEVVEVMDKISRDGTVFEPLGRVLKDKVTGNYHNQPNREYKYNNLTNDETKAFNEFKKKHLFYDSKLNRKKQNFIDGDLLMYKNLILDDYYGEFNPIAVIRDTYTRVFPKEAGDRHFNQGLKNSGCFADSVDGIHTPQAIILKKDLIADEGGLSSVGHEIGHEVGEYLTEQEERELNELYQKAIQENRLLGDYAGRNVDEYFAVGCDSACSVYKPHSHLLSGDYKNTRYTLMSKDPELYKFIMKILKKG